VDRLRRQHVPVRLVTNTTSRSRAMLVERLRGYGFEVSTEDVFTASLAGSVLAHTAGYRFVAPFMPEPALQDMAGLELAGGTSNRPRNGVPQAVMVGDMGERWSYALFQEAF
jgi:hypothetical protein